MDTGLGRVGHSAHGGQSALGQITSPYRILVSAVDDLVSALFVYVIEVDVYNFCRLSRTEIDFISFVVSMHFDYSICQLNEVSATPVL